MARDVVIAGTGRYLPERVVTNAELVDRLKELDESTNEEWIAERTGVLERRVAAPDENTSDMALAASWECLQKAKVSPKDVDLIIVTTVSGDTSFPATANWLQGKLENDRAWSFDINAGCSGFIYGLNAAASIIRARRSNLALVVGAEKMSRLYNPVDRTSYPLAGDGAGCVLLKGIDPKANHGGFGIEGFYTKSDGQMAHLLLQPLGGTSRPLTAENIADPRRYLVMDGTKVYASAVRRMSEAIEKVLEQVKVKKEAVDWFIGHQANKRILEAVAKKLELPLEKVYSNIDKYANTTSATIPICLDELARSGQLKPGHKVVMFAFGTGFTWGACYAVWGS
jgi:3-oxoacyl-[acyl-carrier-protein] synthase-3